MLRVRIDVNGELIDELHIVNRGRVDDSGSDERYYDWSDSAGLSGRVRHRRRRGAAQLVAHVLAERSLQQ